MNFAPLLLLPLALPAFKGPVTFLCLELIWGKFGKFLENENVSIVFPDFSFLVPNIHKNRILK